MLTKTITSLQHPLVKIFVELRKERTVREDRKEVVVVGKKLVRELSESQPAQILMSLHEANNIRSKERYLVSPEILKKITGVASPDGFAAIFSIPCPLKLDAKHKILILDRLSDPGNLGTLFRTALALSWEGIWLTPGTVDPFNDKAIRASRGACFWIPFEWKTKEQIIEWAKETQAMLLTADLAGVSLNEIQPTLPLGLILSHESHGAQSWPSQRVTIPMSPHVESLNVATSGAILLFTLGNQS